MKKAKKVVCLSASFLFGFSSFAFAAIPKGTVVVGDKAFDLQYANDHKNIKEMNEIIQKRNGPIYIKSPTGTWYDNNTSKKTLNKLLPELIYKDSQGNLKNYYSEDGDEIVLEVSSVGFVNKNQIKIKFNKPLDKESALQRNNYLIDSEELKDECEIEYLENEKAVLITLKEDIQNENPIELKIQKSMKDKYMNSINDEYTNLHKIISENSEKDQEVSFNHSISLIEDNQRLKNISVDGDVYISGNNVKISNMNITGKLILDPGNSGTVITEAIKAKKIVVLSGSKNSIYLNSVKADELISSSENKVRIKASSKTKIKKTQILSSTVLEGVKNCFGNISVRTKGTENNLELKGSINSPMTVYEGINLKTDCSNPLDDVVLRANSNDDIINLEGKFTDLKVIKEAQINILENAEVINSIEVNSGAFIKVDKMAKVNEINVNTSNEMSKVNVEGKISNLKINSKADIELKNAEIEMLVVNADGAKLSSDDKSKIQTLVTNNKEYTIDDENTLNIDNTVKTENQNQNNDKDKDTDEKKEEDDGPINISVRGIELEKEELELLIGDVLQLKAKVKPSSASNRKVIWTSSDENIVSIDESGKISATGVGQAIITATTYNKKYKAECKVTVKEDVIKVTGIELSKSEAFLKLNENVKLDAVIMPENATNKDVTWTISNEDVASVENGLITAKAIGETNVTATAVDGNYTASCRVIVSGIKYEYKIVGNQITFTLNDESIKDSDVSVKLFDVNNKNLEFYGNEEAENGKCEISTGLEKGKTYNGTISITDIGKIVIYNFTID
jgi:uncharacterized protein YjdB